MDLDGSLVPPWMLMKRGSPNMALASFMEHALLIRLFLLYAIARLVKVGKLQYTMHEVPVCLHQCRLGHLVPWSSYVRPSTSTEGDARPQCAIYWPPRRDSRRGFAGIRLHSLRSCPLAMPFVTLIYLVHPPFVVKPCLKILHWKHSSLLK